MTKPESKFIKQLLEVIDLTPLQTTAINDTINHRVEEALSAQKSELIDKVLAELNRIGRLLWFNTGSMKAGNLTYDDWLKFKKRIAEELK